jgi:hypothetical protein
LYRDMGKSQINLMTDSYETLIPISTFHEIIGPIYNNIKLSIKFSNAK